MIDFFAGSQTHYLDHLWPLWYALPPEHRGTFWVTGAPVAEVLATTSHAKVGTPGNFGGPTVVAGSADASRVDARRPLAYVEHGAGQRYIGDPRPGETNALRRCALHLTPRLTGEAKHQIPIGCPKLDPFINAPHGDAIAIAPHWHSTLIPETRSALPEFEEAAAELAKHYEVIGHGHPRAWAQVSKVWSRQGIEPMASWSEVMQRAGMVITDTSSIGFEFAHLDRPVVWLNSIHYRRNVHHGLRFWSHVGVGFQVDRPQDLRQTVERALAGERPEQRDELIGEVYSVQTGGARLAVEAMMASDKTWRDEMARNPKAAKYQRAPQPQPEPLVAFPTQRLRRIGAPSAMIEQARRYFEGLDSVEQEASAAHYEAMPDAELRKEVERFGADQNLPDVSHMTIPQVLKWVGDSPERAGAALDAERSREERHEGRGRSTLIARLQSISE